MLLYSSSEVVQTDAPQEATYLMSQNVLTKGTGVLIGKSPSHGLIWLFSRILKISPAELTSSTSIKEYEQIINTHFYQVIYKNHEMSACSLKTLPVIILSYNMEPLADSAVASAIKDGPIRIQDPLS